MSESIEAKYIRLEAARDGVELWRNNVGALPDRTGRIVRYGLCNESAKQNQRIKSSDWIGITPLLILPQHFGMTIGVFTAIETKESGWVYSPTDERAVAQKIFHDIVIRAGGYAGFARNIEDYKLIVRK